MLLTRPKWVTLSLLHGVSLRNVVELWEPPKLLPHGVVVQEGPHGVVNVPDEALQETAGCQADTATRSETPPRQGKEK